MRPPRGAFPGGSAGPVRGSWGASRRRGAGAAPSSRTNRLAPEALTAQRFTPAAARCIEVGQRPSTMQRASGSDQNQEHEHAQNLLDKWPFCNLFCILQPCRVSTATCWTHPPKDFMGVRRNIGPPGGLSPPRTPWAPGLRPARGADPGPFPFPVTWGLRPSEMPLDPGLWPGGPGGASQMQSSASALRAKGPGSKGVRGVPEPLLPPTTTPPPPPTQPTSTTR